jgi:hypothetical protein
MNLSGRAERSWRPNRIFAGTEEPFSVFGGSPNALMEYGGANAGSPWRGLKVSGRLDRASEVASKNGTRVWT